MDRRKLLALLGLTAGAVALPKAPEARPVRYYPSDPPLKIEMPVGMIVPWVGKPGDQLMPNWMLCDGRELRVEEYGNLFGVIGRTYGGTGHQIGTFNLPDLRARFGQNIIRVR
jgi:hypothetical protein